MKALCGLLDVPNVVERELHPALEPEVPNEHPGEGAAWGQTAPPGLWTRGFGETLQQLRGAQHCSLCHVITVYPGSLYQTLCALKTFQ